MERQQRRKLIGMGALGLVLLLLVAVPGYFLAEQRGALPLFWQLVRLYFAVILMVCTVSVIISVTRGRRRRRAYLAEVTPRIEAFGADHTDSLSVVSPTLQQLSRALSELDLPGTGSAKAVIWAARPGMLALWALDPRVRLIAEIPAEMISSIAFRPVARSTRAVMLTAGVESGAGSGTGTGTGTGAGTGTDAGTGTGSGTGAVELPLMLAPLNPKHSTERGRERLIELLRDALYEGVVADLPEGTNVLLTD